MMELPTSLKAEYARLESDRSSYLSTARDCSKYTLPALVPPMGRTAGTKLRRGYSNYGARAVNSLASKLLLTVLPARQSFFKFEVTKALLDQLGTDKAARTEVDKALAELESIIKTDIEVTATRTPLGEAIKHLLVAGNVMLQVLADGSLRLYPLQAYVALRDAEGNLLRAVAEDRVSPLTLPETVRGAVLAKLKDSAGKGTAEKTVSLFTGVFRKEDGAWEAWQEVEGIEVPQSRGTYKADELPFMVLRWTPVDGESYGRSLVEDYLGYFTSLEALSAALVKGTAAASKLLYLRKPNGVVKARSLTQSETGDVIDGNPEDVGVLTTEKQHDFRTARECINDLKEELAYAFAMNQAVQRQAERVTAEEIRFMAQDLDALLGGNYSTISLEFQRPYLRRKLVQLERAGRVPKIPKGALVPVIVTGLDALGRGAELDNLKALVKDVVDLGGPEALDTYLNFDDLLSRLATARGVKTEGLVKDQAQVAAALQAKQMQAMVDKLGPNAVTQMGQMMQQGQQAPAAA